MASQQNPSGGKQPVKPDSIVQCPICLQRITEPFTTKCGHSFCYNCINLHLAEHRFCPMQGCGHSPITRDDIFPNFLLNKVVTSGISLPGEQGGARESVTQITESLLQEGDQLSVNDVDSLIATLLEKRRTMQNETHLQDLQVCSDFLHRARRQRELRKEQLELEMSVIDGDLERLKQAAASNGKAARRNPSPRVGGVRDIDGATKGKEPASAMKRKRGGEEHQLLARVQSGDLDTESIFTEARTPATDAQTASEALSEKTRRVCSHFDDLQDAYFESHQVHQGAPGTALRRFQHSLFKFTRYSAFKIFSELKYGTIFHTSSIVSSIEFDRDDQYFATAGVSKKIKIFEYKTIVEQSHLETHPPIREMSCRSKISCLCWSPYVQQQIASSDYEGIVSLWDAYVDKPVTVYEEHEKRAWSVDFSPAKPTIFASGSDDSKVKIWSVNQDHSVATIDSKANVCCVKFNPESCNHIAFGSADHHIHYFDLRNLREELFVYRGHSKAVSYVRFLGPNELVSASTDSTLKLWSANRNECKRTFTGHTNEKNFVGLSTAEDYIACGSENNAVFVYYKALSKPVIRHKFQPASLETGEDTNFVSSVCWKKDSGVLLAANSLGVINMMKMV